MPAATKTPSENIVIEYACGTGNDRGDRKTATQARSIVQKLARALARIAAREDDAAENGGSP